MRKLGKKRGKVEIKMCMCSNVRTDVHVHVRTDRKSPPSGPKVGTMLSQLLPFQLGNVFLFVWREGEEGCSMILSNQTK